MTPTPEDRAAFRFDLKRKTITLGPGVYVFKTPVAFDAPEGAVMRAVTYAPDLSDLVTARVVLRSVRRMVGRVWRRFH